MKKIVIMITASFAMLFASTTFASQAQFSFYGLSGYNQNEEGMERIVVTAEKNGMISIRGSGITEIVSEPVVVEDSRGTDGPLVLKIGSATMTIGSGFTPDGTISYSMSIYGGKSFILNPIVRLSIK